MVVKADVFEEAGYYVVELELPGVGEDSVELLVYDTLLTIRGTGVESAECDTRIYYRRERKPGPFERHISLPGPAWRNFAKAMWRGDILVVRIPKNERRSPGFASLVVGRTRNPRWRLCT